MRLQSTTKTLDPFPAAEDESGPAGVGVAVGVFVGVLEAVRVGLGVGVLVGVRLGVLVGVGLGVLVGVGVVILVGLGVASKVKITSLNPLEAPLLQPLNRKMNRKMMRLTAASILDCLAGRLDQNWKKPLESMIEAT
ncbi:MAG: hypothetical protein ACLQU2_27945 [Candidatus Binataceae bacterium]